MKTAIAIQILLSIAYTGNLVLAAEYKDIEFGRELINRKSFPTIEEFEILAEQGDISLALMFRLVKSSANVVNPTWSSDGKRLSFQKVDTKQKVSNIFVFDHLGMEKPTALSDRAKTYDYMFRWAVGSPTAFIFARLTGSDVRFLGNFNTDSSKTSTSIPVSKPRDLGLSGDLYANPALYVRTDRIARIAFDRKGKIFRVASRVPGKNSSAREVTPGQSPRWNRDGQHLLAIERDASGTTTGRLAIADITKPSIKYFGTKSGHARSPNWSPDEQYVSCDIRATRVADAWAIKISPVTQKKNIPLIDEDIVVNPDFTTLGPCWNPDSSQLWFFSKQYRDAAYYPLVMKNIQSNDSTVIDYPKVCTSPSEVTMNPVTAVPEIVFVGHRDLAQDVFVLMLNHF